MTALTTRPVMALAALLALASLPARATTIDFDASTADDYLFTPYEEDGFTITVQDGHYDLFGPGIWCNLTSGECPDNFINVDDSVYGPATVRIAPTGGGLFDLTAMTILDVYQYNQQTYQFSACGTGCLVTSSTGGSRQVEMGTLGFTGAGWTGVEWIEISARTLAGAPSIASVAVDDIEVDVSSVPAPPAAWLLGTALAAAGARLRRRPRT